MSKKITWLVTGIITAILICATIIGMTQPKDAEPIEKVQRKDWSKYPGLELETKTKETDLYTSSISYLITEDKQINKTIKDWISSEKEQFMNQMYENKSILNTDHRANITITVDTHQMEKHLYSVEFTSYQFAGGANGREKKKIFNIDTSSQKLLTIHDMVDGEENLDLLRRKIKDQLKNDKNLSPYVFEEYLEKALEDPNDWKWSIDTNYFRMYFDEYEIAAGAAGGIEVKIPMKEVQSQLSVNIQGEPTEHQSSNSTKENGERKPLDPNGKYVALTFDDGPSPKVTPDILKTLKEHYAKATFFMLGSQVDFYPDLAKKVSEDGHEIANHTLHHRDLSQLGQEQIEHQIKESEKIITKATGQENLLIRPPYGAYNDKVESVAQAANEPLILWSVDSLDWQSLNEQDVITTVEHEVVPNSIVLLHDIHPSTGKALPELLSALEDQGYEFVTVSQLLTLKQFDESNPVFGAVK
ncbi:polysaccharide deacetylase family protein [Rossellomorea aquimaris]|nr:polysaccharide deacetylase family protein [Rossellomorea aquimaris]